MEPIELDYMEYANDAAAQAAFVSNFAHISRYPTQDDAHVKATTKYDTSYWPYYATDPTKSLTGGWGTVSWLSANLAISNQRFHIDLGSAKVVKRIYYENAHSAGINTNAGAKNFTFWGSNDAGDFADLTYANNGTWVQLATSPTALDQHAAADAADPKYIVVTNTTAYRYYAFKFADNYGHTGQMGVRRIELQEEGLWAHSEATIKVQGNYALKSVAIGTDSLNKTLTRTVSPTINLTDKTIIKFDMRASRTGSNIKIGIHDSGGTTTEITPNILAADTWQTVVWDLSGVANGNKDVIDSIIITVVNADAENTFYIDNIFGHVIENFLTFRGRNRFKFSGISLG